MRVFLSDSVADCNLSAPLLSGENVESVFLDRVSPKKEKIIATLPSVKDLFSLLKTRYAFNYYHDFLKFTYGLNFNLISNCKLEI